MQEEDLMKLDLYNFMGIPVYSKIEAIKIAFKQRALKIHPDKNTDQNATSNFQLLSAVFKLLGNEIKKSAYDRLLKGRQLARLKELRADIEQFYVDVKAEKRKLGLLLDLYRTDTTFRAHRCTVIFCNTEDAAQFLKKTFLLEIISLTDDNNEVTKRSQFSLNQSRGANKSKPRTISFLWDSSPPLEDEESISLIINYQLPDDPRLYGDRVNRGSATLRITQDGCPVYVPNEKVRVVNFLATAADHNKLKNIKQYYRTNIVQMLVNVS